MSNNKRCSKCDQIKLVTEFYSASRCHCKECERKEARWRMARPENVIGTALRDAHKTAVKFGVEDTLTLDELRYLFALSGGRCAYTGKFMTKPSVDHYVPLSRGGANAFWNVLIVDWSVNKQKHDTDPSDWLWQRQEVEREQDFIRLLATRRGVSIAEMAGYLAEFQAAYNDERIRRLLPEWVVKYKGKEAVS
ncbi:hypothetical protein MKZ02_21065 [Pseudobacillus sp. FSL P4-0506]|uniref:HNH endonuclease domain-containing protein n=1 Tax=Pseudobacillus sp. FSL P4-0506 TaxID=2921576 RepID=UPI0030FC5127